MMYQIDHDQVVLVIVDLQEKLMKAVSRRDAVLRNTLILVELARQFKIPIIVTEQYPRGLGPTEPEIRAVLKDDIVLEKIDFSAEPVLREHLREIGRKQVIIVGSETHVCVFQTVRALVHSGYGVQVPCDAVCSRFDMNHENGLSLMKEIGAVISNTETIVFDVLVRSGTPEFKIMSPLVK